MINRYFLHKRVQIYGDTKVMQKQWWAYIRFYMILEKVPFTKPRYLSYTVLTVLVMLPRTSWDNQICWVWLPKSKTWFVCGTTSIHPKSRIKNIRFLMTDFSKPCTVYRSSNYVQIIETLIMHHQLFFFCVSFHFYLFLNSLEFSITVHSMHVSCKRTNEMNNNVC